MKVIIINPPAENTVQEFPDSEGEGYLEADDYGYFPPLGPLYVLSYAEKHVPHHTYYFVDAVGEKLSYTQLEERIKKISPDVIGITSFTISLVDVMKTAEMARKLCPSAHLVLGGHHPTAFPFEAAQLPHFNTIIVGEAEYAFAELLRRIEQFKPYEDIVGVYTKQNISALAGNTLKDSRFLAHITVPPAYVDDVDDLPAPNRHYIKHINYESVIGLTGKLATIITTRGCPYKCTFCDVPYKKYRQRNIELVMDEIETCLELGYEEFHFYDDLFNITEQKILDFCDAIDKRGLKIVWDFRGRVNAVTFKSLKRGKETGLRMISFGVETGTDQGLKALKKGTKTEQVKKAFAWCRELGIKTVANYMIGLPHEESIDHIHKSIDFLIELDPDYAQIAILNLYPHTEVFNQGIKKGIVKEGKWEEFALNPNSAFKVDHWTEFLTEQQLVKLHREAYRRFYFRLPYIWRSIVQTTSVYEFKSKVAGVRKLLKI